MKENLQNQQENNVYKNLIKNLMLKMQKIVLELDQLDFEKTLI